MSEESVECKKSGYNDFVGCWTSKIKGRNGVEKRDCDMVSEEACLRIEDANPVSKSKVIVYRPRESTVPNEGHTTATHIHFKIKLETGKYRGYHGKISILDPKDPEQAEVRGGYLEGDSGEVDRWLEEKQKDKPEHETLDDGGWLGTRPPA
jgi:hypothetical protein